jgi:hypothetical protein
MQGDGGGSLHRPYRLRTRHLDWTRAKESQRQRTILLTLLDLLCSHLAPYHSNLGVSSGMRKMSGLREGDLARTISC